MDRRFRHVHFVGIGGIGMLALAQYLVSRNVEVSGSDLQTSDALVELSARGATIATGHDPANVRGADLVVVTSAASRENPEVAEARALGIPIMKRAKLLGLLTNGARSIAVSGTHGKTTTTALIGHLLRQNGIDVTVLGGGFVREASGGLAGPAVVGSDTGFVVEADEYDRSFLQLRPDLLVITGIDFDHPDCYDTLGDMVGVYERFASQVSELVVVAGDSPEAVQVARTAGVAFQTYGVTGPIDWAARDVHVTGSDSRFRLCHGQTDLGTFCLRIPGRHNVMNAVAALAAANWYSRRAGHPFGVADFGEALSSFKGVARRLELRGSVDGVSVIDDYAHHPAEISASVQALRAPGARVKLVFQPHTYTRTQALFDDFVEALTAADEVALLDVYGARENPIAGVNSQGLADAVSARGGTISHFTNHAGAVEHVAAAAKTGDRIVTMGAGDVWRLADPILNRLRERRAQPVEVGATPPSDANGFVRPHRTSRIRSALAEAGLTRIRDNEPMSRHTSWRVGGAADLFATAETPDALRSALLISAQYSIPCLVIGAGSNILVSDDGIEGLVVVNRIRTLRIFPGQDGARIEAGSGVFFARLALFSVKKGYAGLEWGVAIPGTVGAGIVNNAGAHHGDVEQALVSVEAVDSSGGQIRLGPEDLNFRYRQSALKRTDGSPITHTELAISRCWFGAVEDREGRSPALIEELMAARKATQPISEASAGSTFTNPEGGSAGSYLERAGLKGVSIGGAQISTKHANFVVNMDSATASDIARLIRHARSTVRSHFDVALEPEVQLVGRWAEAYPLLETADLVEAR
jgi:UDP-N-acetylmuramate--alanine ligase